VVAGYLGSITASPRGIPPFHLAVAAAGVAAVLLWMFAIAVMREAPYALCPSIEPVEGSSLRTELALWPPGATECEYTAPSGAVTRTTHVPWREWGAVALFALGAAGMAAAVLAAARRWLWVYGGLVLVVGGIAVWFIGGAGVLLVAAALTPAIALAIAGRIG
jgi:hypothetical protein